MCWSQHPRRSERCSQTRGCMTQPEPGVATCHNSAWCAGTASTRPSVPWWVLWHVVQPAVGVPRPAPCTRARRLQLQSSHTERQWPDPATCAHDPIPQSVPVTRYCNLPPTCVPVGPTARDPIPQPALNLWPLLFRVPCTLCTYCPASTFHPQDACIQACSVILPASGVAGASLGQCDPRRRTSHRTCSTHTQYSHAVLTP